MHLASSVQQAIPVALCPAVLPEYHHARGKRPEPQAEWLALQVGDSYSGEVCRLAAWQTTLAVAVIPTGWLLDH